MKINIFRRLFNRTLHLLAMNLPGLRNLRPLLHRLQGVKIHGNVAIGDQVYIENEYPECVEIDDGSAIGLRSTIIAHHRGQGRVVISKNVWIGTNSVICASAGRTLSIGDGAIMGIGSIITSNVQSRTFVSAERAKPIAKVSGQLTLKSSYDDHLCGLVPLRKGQ